MDLDTAPTHHLTAPAEVAALISKMQQENPTGEVIDDQEAAALLDSINEAKTESLASAKKKGKERWVPRGEGSSGNPPSVPPVVTTKDQSPVELEPAPALFSDHGHDNGDPGLDHDESEPGEELVADERPTPTEGAMDDELIESLQEFVKQEVGVCRAALLTEVSQVRNLISRLSTASARHATRISDLEIKVRTGQATASLTGGQANQTGGKKTSSTGKVSSPPASVSQIRSTATVGDPMTEVRAILAANPTYPPVRAVRRRVVATLASRLAFKIPDGDIPPKGWTEDGLLAHVTKG